MYFLNYKRSIQPLVAVIFIATLVSCDSQSNTTLVNLDDQLTDKERLSLEQSKQQASRTNQNTFFFGFDLRASPQEDSRQYQPFLRYLENSTGYKFELRFTPKNSSIIDELGTGKIHFAALGAVSYIQGHEKYGIINIASGLNKFNKAKYQSMIVTAANSPINNMRQLKNKRFAFGSIDSTQGHLIPRIILRDHNIKLKDFAAYKYTGSHQNCAEAVISSRFDACGMQDTMAIAMKEQGLLNILHTSKYYPSSGIAANQNIPNDIIQNVKQALLNFDPNGKYKDKLYHWSKTEMPNGFSETENEYYIEMKESLAELNLLETQ